MVAIAQQVEHLVVVQGVAGSSPVSHPSAGLGRPPGSPGRGPGPDVVPGPGSPQTVMVPETEEATIFSRTAFTAGLSGPGAGTSMAAR